MCEHTSILVDDFNQHLMKAYVDPQSETETLIEEKLCESLQNKESVLMNERVHMEVKEEIVENCGIFSQDQNLLVEPSTDRDSKSGKKIQSPAMNINLQKQIKLETSSCANSSVKQNVLYSSNQFRPPEVKEKHMVDDNLQIGRNGLEIKHESNKNEADFFSEYEFEMSDSEKLNVSIPNQTDDYEDSTVVFDEEIEGKTEMPLNRLHRNKAKVLLERLNLEAGVRYKVRSVRSSR